MSTTGSRKRVTEVRRSYRSRNLEQYTPRHPADGLERGQPVPADHELIPPVQRGQVVPQRTRARLSRSSRGRLGEPLKLSQPG
jgi:hypothetical protein